MARKKSKKVNIFFVIIMLAVLGYFYYKFDASQSLQSKVDEQEMVNIKTFPDDLVINKEVLAVKPKWYKEVTAEYPVGDAVGVATVAQFVRDEADQLWCTNDEENLSEKDIKKKGNLEMYECSLEIKYSYTHSYYLLSHKLGEYGMYGGVHGIYSAETFTYDTDGNKLAFADMVLNKETYKKDISEKLKAGFKNYQRDTKDANFDSIIDEVTAETNIDTLPYIATKDGLVFLFSETQGLSYASGEVEIAIPFAELVGVLKPEFLN